VFWGRRLKKVANFFVFPTPIFSSRTAAFRWLLITVIHQYMHSQNKSWTKYNKNNLTDITKLYKQTHHSVHKYPRTVLTVATLWIFLNESARCDGCNFNRNSTFLLCEGSDTVLVLMGGACYCRSNLYSYYCRCCCCRSVDRILQWRHRSCRHHRRSQDFVWGALFLHQKSWRFF